MNRRSTAPALWTLLPVLGAPLGAGGRGTFLVGYILGARDTPI